MPSCGEVVVELLERSGAETVFGIPGVHTLEIYRGLARSRLRHVAPRHEQGAAFMADGWARVTGRPGVCVLISGPGLTNAVTPIAQAYHDSIPLLVISGAVAASDRGNGEIHDLPDQQALMASVTAFSREIADPAMLPEAFAEAAELFGSRRPRPVHIAVPVDVLRRPAAGGATSPVAGAPAPPLPPTPPREEIERAAQLLAAARRPLLILGGGARDAGREAQAIAERLGAPVGLTINARGTISDSHELCLGSALSFPPVDDLLRDADATLLVGAQLSGLELWGLDEPLKLRGLVRIDIDADALQRRWQPEVALHGDARQALTALADALARVQDGRGAHADVRAGVARRVAGARRGLRPPEEVARFMPVLALLDRVLPEDRIIAGDSTQPVYAANHLLPAYSPRSWLMPIGYGSLGCALPMAIGAKLAAPERPVVAIAGDGGFMFTLQELATARELGLSLPVLVYNNHGYGEIRDSMDHAAIPRVGTEANHDVAAIARGFGCATASVTELAQLEDALTSALAAGGPTVIELTAYT
jgi:thiamine pyrophosphate-dependent acetolactate synthase large subunit-like protein